MRGSQLPQSGRMLPCRHRDLHGHGRHLHASLSVLRRSPWPAPPSRSAVSRVTSREPRARCNFAMSSSHRLIATIFAMVARRILLPASRRFETNVPTPASKYSHRIFAVGGVVHWRYSPAVPPDVFNHNLETVPRLYREVRPGADYKGSLELLTHLFRVLPHVPTKSGLMLGLGETHEEVVSVMEDLRTHGVEMLTLGQYLQPSLHHLAGNTLLDARKNSPSSPRLLPDSGSATRPVDPWCGRPITPNRRRAQLAHYSSVCETFRGRYRGRSVYRSKSPVGTGLESDVPICKARWFQNPNRTDCIGRHARPTRRSTAYTWVNVNFMGPTGE
jgi:hypothetical protein